jgi:hypothetical protein
MRLLQLTVVCSALALAACARQVETKPDPRVGLKPGRYDAGEAIGNLKIVATRRSPEKFENSTNSDLAFTGQYAIQGNYNGFQIWDISNPSNPVLATSYYCPASQSDVSVYKNLLFVSGEGTGGRLDCGDQGVRDTVSAERLRGLRIFDISDIKNPKYVANVQTCRGSHTHTVLEHPGDRDNVYVYISGSSTIRSPRELPGCINDVNDPNNAYFRIEVIKVPLANPTAAAIAGSPRFFENLVAPPRHGLSQADIADEARMLAEARARGGFIYTVNGQDRIATGRTVRPLLDSIVRARGGTGRPTAQDSLALQSNLQRIMDARDASRAQRRPSALAQRGPTQCHDITVYPALGLAGGACEGYGFLLDISNPVNPVRVDAVADSNFSYWHSATFNNDGTKILFSDEWGGGSSPKCRAGDPKEWGADAIFTIEPGRKMNFKSYYKLSAVQTSVENCVAHNGSLIPIPDRDVMVQSWYQGGISIFDFTDPSKPFEIAYFDRGPVDSTRNGGNAGSWSAYWYNGAMFSSEIGRGLDVAELVPSEFVSQNEIDAAKTVRFDHFNAQGQPKFVWPPSFALARAYVDQLERSKCWDSNRIASVRQQLSTAEAASGTARRDGLQRLAGEIEGARGGCNAPKITKLATTARALAGIQP